LNHVHQDPLHTASVGQLLNLRDRARHGRNFPRLRGKSGKPG
jgi:hypothetical protein